jgi:hypothetical protein
MKLITLGLLSLFAVLLSGLGSYSCGEFAEESQISFSVAYDCSEEGNDKNRSQLCLADSLKPGLEVVLVSKDVKCSAKTGRTFEPLSNLSKSTRLEGTENCLTKGKKRDIDVVVLGVDASAVRVIEPKTDESFLSAETQLKAREFARSEYRKRAGSEYEGSIDVADPDVFGVGNTAFLLFEPENEVLPWYGLPVLVLNNNVFSLKGRCVSNPPFFFSVKEKLYVSYWATVACCDCADSNFFVYDLSGKSPKLVYWNSADDSGSRVYIKEVGVFLVLPKDSSPLRRQKPDGGSFASYTFSNWDRPGAPASSVDIMFFSRESIRRFENYCEKCETCGGEDACETGQYPKTAEYDGQREALKNPRKNKTKYQAKRFGNRNFIVSDHKHIGGYECESYREYRTFINDIMVGVFIDWGCDSDEKAADRLIAKLKILEQ